MFDRQGSVVALSDKNGRLDAINAYDEYGVPISNVSGEDVAGRFGYTGQAWIPELGLWHYKARFYSPTLGRFMQTDPIGYEDQVNLYAYVGNDPVNMIDPMGLECEPVDKETNTTTCTVDDTSGMTEDEISAANEAYTNAVNDLLADSDGKITIQMGNENGTETLEVNKGDLAGVLIGATVTYGGIATTNGQANHQIKARGGRTAEGNLGITLFKKALHVKPLGEPYHASTRPQGSIEMTFKHEGVHFFDESFRNRVKQLGIPFSTEHTNPYNNAIGGQ